MECRHFTPRKSPFGECFVLDWAQTGVEKGVGRGPKHSTKACRGAGAVAHGGTGWPRMVGGAVFSACGDDQAGASQQGQHRDLGLLRRSLQSEEGTDQRLAPRLAQTCQQHLRQTLTPEGHRAWSDKTLQRILAHRKT